MTEPLVVSDNLENLINICPGSRAKRIEKTALSLADQELLNCLGLPDSLFSSTLPSGISADGRLRIILVDDAADSQYDALLAALRAGRELPSPAACVAFTGRNFHGQRQRPWFAQRGNLHLTLYSQPDVNIAETRTGLIVLPALAAIDAISTLAGGNIGLGIKWVNDIMIGDGKLGGVLTATQLQGHRTETVVFGIGLNIAAPPKIEPSPFVPQSDFLQAHLPGVSLRDVFWQFMKEFEKRYRQLLRQGSGALLDDYRRHSLILRREVCIWDEDSLTNRTNWIKGEPLACGVVSSIEDDLSLRVNDKEIYRGRVSLTRICDRYGFKCDLQ
ncbi:MAG: biotin--[acetyl-CoA-carboxylase] ligase [Smithellaceae bacterium]|nr:biotin--[acetyl-CoA-carboxylase] ligase [Smithellaceae bacterium]